MAYADDVNLLGDNMDTVNKNREPLINASKEIGIYVILSPEWRSKSDKE
jgi:hypothetical protein